MPDILQTVLQLTGAGAYVNSLNQAAQAHRILAQAQQQQARAQAQVARAAAMGRAAPAGAAATAGGAGLPGAFGGAALALATGAISAVGIAVKEATDSFMAYDRAVIAAELTTKNMGKGLPVAELRGLARQLSLSTGQSETEFVKTAGYVARFGTDARTTRRALLDIADASTITEMSLEETARIFEKMRKGNAKAAFVELGIPIKGVEGQLYDFNQALDITEKHFHGMAVAMGKELPGQAKRADAAIEIMKNEVGRALSPQLSAWQKFKTGMAIGIADIAYLASHGFHIPPAGTTQGAAPGAAGLGGPGKPRSEEYLRRIEQNTGPQGALGRALRGGGSYGETGGGLHIRDLNRLMRHW